MSYGTMVYSVDFDKLESVFNSGDDKARRMISGRFRANIYSTNDQLGWSNERGADNVFEGIRHLIMGGEKNLPGVMYGYAYKYIVEFYGTFLSNEHFYPCNSAWQEEHIQPQLDALGVKLSLLSLSFGGALTTFPTPDDFPGIGRWTPAAIATALPIMAAASDLSPELAEIKSWLAFASAKGNGLVGFYH